MKKIAIVAAAVLPLAFTASSSFAATKSASVCANHALSAADKKECKAALAHAKGKTAKAQVKSEYQAKIDAAKKH